MDSYSLSYLFLISNNHITVYSQDGETFAITTRNGENSQPYDFTDFWKWWKEDVGAYVPSRHKLDFAFLADYDMEDPFKKENFLLYGGNLVEETYWTKSKILDFCRTKISDLCSCIIENQQEVVSEVRFNGDKKFYLTRYNVNSKEEKKGLSSDTSKSKKIKQKSNSGSGQESNSGSGDLVIIMTTKELPPSEKEKIKKL